MKKYLSSIACLLCMMACRQGNKPQVVTVADSSAAGKADSTMVAQSPDSAKIMADTLSYAPEQLVGTWLRPVSGLEKEMQGFDLRKDGSVKSVNMYSLVYEKWQLQRDTLLLWNHTEGEQQPDSAATIDTTIIKNLTDTTLVLFPVKAAEGYVELYTRTKAKPPKRKGKK